MPSKPQSDVRITLGTIELSKWVKYEIESDIFSPADAFSISISNIGGEAIDKVSVFDPVQVVIDGTVQMTGYVDEVNRSIHGDQGPTIEVTGRDRFGQLVDNAAPPKNYNRVNLVDLAQTIATPWVTEWISDNEENRVKLIKARQQVARLSQQIARFEKVGDKYKAEVLAKRKARAQANLSRIRAKHTPRVKVEPGETIFEVLERFAAKSGMLLWQAADGKGIIARPNYDQKPLYAFLIAPDGDPAQQQNNVLGISVVESVQDRFKTYRMVHTSGNTSSVSGSTVRYDVTSTDDEVPLERTMVGTASDAQNRREALDFAERERDRRRFDSLKIQLTVRDHGQNDVVYQVDTMATLQDKVNGIDGTFYVSRRRFIGDDSGQTTELELRQPGVFLA